MCCPATQQAILADHNSRLINVASRDEPEQIAAALKRYQASHSDYFAERRRQYPDSAQATQAKKHMTIRKAAS